MNLSKLPPSTPNERSIGVDIWVVVQKRCPGLSFSSILVLDTISLLRTDSGPVVIGKLKAKYLKPYRPWLKPVIETASIPSSHEVQDLEAQSFPREVAITKSKKSLFFTRVFRRPTSLAASSIDNFVDQHLAFAIVSRATQPRKTILIKTEYNSLAFVFLLFITAIVILGLAIGVGFATRHATLGFATWGAGFPIVAVVEAFLFWKWE